MSRKNQLLLAVLCLCIFGLLMVYSSSSIWADYKFHDSFHYVKYQSFFFLIGFLIMMILSNIPYSFYEKKVNWILFTCFFLLVAVLIPGIGSIRNGSRSWFGIGSLGIQPSEASKIGIIMFTSHYLSISESFIQSYRKGVFPILFITLCFFGLIMLQPDLGTGVILFLSVLSLLFIAGVDLKFFLGGGVLGVAGLVGLIVVAPYRMQRILSFLDPWKDALGTGFQMIQSLYAIGPGGLLGVGFLHSIQKHFYLPEPQTDFIFSVIAEEFGVIGVLFVVCLFVWIWWQGIHISLECSDLFGKYLSFGIVFQLLFQTALNLMVVVGLIPVTGVTLPFLSYGGSSLLISMSSIGILMNISKNGSKKKV